MSKVKGHVHFGSSNDEQKNNSIIISSLEDDVIDIYLGFLQYQHRYNVSVGMVKTLFMGHGLSDILEAIESVNPSMAIKIESFEERLESTGFLLQLQFFAYKETIIREVVELKFTTEPKQLRLKFSARILGKGKGTPLLRDGIKCTGIEHDDVSEVSDFPGFD